MIQKATGKRDMARNPSRAIKNKDNTSVHLLVVFLLKYYFIL